MSDDHSKVNEKLELCQLLVDRGDLLLASEKLESLSKKLYSKKQFPSYLQASNLLIRTYAELGLYNSIVNLKDKLQELMIKEGIQLNSKTHFVLGLSCIHRDQVEKSKEHFEEALKLALTNDDKSDISHALYGLAATYFKMGRLEDALKELYNLGVFFQVVSLPKLEISSLILNGYILKELDQKEKAIDIYWQAYGKLKRDKNLFSYLTLMYAMGVVYLEMGNKSLARVYLELALKTIDPKNLVELYKSIKIAYDSLGEDKDTEFDLVVNFEKNQVLEKSKGRVDFKSQFVLLDLLKLFVQKPGEVFSKEELVKSVWKQDYNPSVHDNKVYVTIKRLRKLIEPDYDHPRYIFRTKNGYFLNKNTSVSLRKH